MKSCLITSILFIFTINVFAQSKNNDIITSAGDYTSSLNTSISWTLGEPLIETYSKGNTLLTLGFQQVSNEIITFNLSEKNIKSDIKINVYPNPTSDLVKIHIIGLNNSHFSLSIYDVYGKEIISSDFKAENAIQDVIIQDINLSQYSQGSYFLKISSTSKSYAKFYKIVKY